MQFFRQWHKCFHHLHLLNFLTQLFLLVLHAQSHFQGVGIWCSFLVHNALCSSWTSMWNTFAKHSEKGKRNIKTFMYMRSKFHWHKQLSLVYMAEQRAWLVFDYRGRISSKKCSGDICLFAQKGQWMIHRDVLVVETSKVVQLMEATILYAVK